MKKLIIKQNILDNFKPTWLFIKRHNKTGKLYLGKTFKRNPYSYKGSGSLWNQHLKRHGEDVTTIWAQLFDCPYKVHRIAIFLTKYFKIVESSDWANQVKEGGLGGGGLTKDQIKYKSDKAKGFVHYKDPLTNQTYRLQKKDKLIQQLNLVPCHIGMTNVPDIRLPGAYIKVPVEYAKKFGLRNNRYRRSTYKHSTTGEIIELSMNDIRVKSGEYVGITKGTACVKDINGNMFRVTFNDPRILTGELEKIGFQPGEGLYINKDGITKKLLNTDSRVLSKEFIHINTGKAFYKNVNTGEIVKMIKGDPRTTSSDWVGINAGLGVYKNRAGHVCKLTKTDPRVLSKEYVGVKSKYFDNN